MDRLNLLHSNIIFILFFIITSCANRPSDDLCVLLKLSHCDGGAGRNIRRNSSQSIPSVSSASQFNPANVTHDRGIGTEVVYHFKQNPNFNFISGTGKTGAAFLSSQLENTFFSNNIPELESDYINRVKEKYYYTSKKNAFAGSIRAAGNKDFGLDLGFITKYNPPIGKLNLGAGAAFRVKFLTLASAIYKDDVNLELNNKLNYDSGLYYQNIFGKPIYQETFSVQTYSAGINFRTLFLDAGVIKTHYEFYGKDQKVTIYSASYIWDKFLFNYAQRTDELPRWYLDNNIAKKLEVKKNTFGAIQLTLGKSVVAAIQYNYYLLQEFSTSLSIFF